MVRFRLPERASAARRQAPLLPPPDGSETPPTPRDLLVRSWAGRLFLASAAVKLLIGLLRLAVTPPYVLEVLSGAATIGLAIAVGYFLWRLFVLTKRHLLWRVRRKLIISYIFIGVLPAVLIIGFFLLSAALVSMTVSAYLFKDGYDSIVESVGIISQAAAADIAKAPKSTQEILTRTEQVARARFKNMNISLAFVPEPRSGLAPAQTGPWEHVSPPDRIPAWAATSGFDGTISLPVKDGGSGEVLLVIRGVRAARGQSGFAGTVVTDVVIDDQALGYLYERTGVKGTSSAPTASAAMAARGDQGWAALFRYTVTFLEATPWVDGRTRPSGRAAIGMTYSVSDLWERLSGAQAGAIRGTGMPLGQAFLFIVAGVAFLFLIIQGVALLMGLALARSITSSIHELFTGTERVQQGDFTHRIQVTTKDQLGELAQSFNQMTGSIEGLLQTAAEKKRLDEELRIARQIQMSLLPRGPLEVPGLGITALCVPAREVGGDYYDFFHLPDDRIGVLIADVAGKGTSAALYMAELKGLVLALSQTELSPRRMLIEVNRIISDNLDTRSFITMTYGVIDRRAGVMTYCRAGHTPLIFLPGPASPLPGHAQILTPSGMVVGLRIPGAAEKFADLLEEVTIDLRVGDVIVFYTDGISEAMNVGQDLFGEGRLSRIVEEHGHLASGELRERILREIEAFVGAADQHDDMTMILLKVENSFVASV